jgi:hypothetical protein
MSSKKNNTSQRLQPYRAMIPFYILYDLDLNSNHLRFYGQIEQMVHNPNPNVIPRFSYSWIAKELGIARRNAIKVGQLLIAKGYIKHTEVDKDKWLWEIIEKPAIDNEGPDKDISSQGDPKNEDQIDEPSDAERHHAICDTSDAERHPPSDAERHLKIPKDKIPKYKTNKEICKNFDLFWNIFPIKKQEDLCRKIWISRNLDSMGKEIVSKLKQQITYDKQWIDGYNPSARRYLDESLWNDQIALVKKSGHSAFSTKKKPRQYLRTSLRERFAIQGAL